MKEKTILGKLDEQQAQAIVGGMNKGELVHKVAERTGVSTRKMAFSFMESLTIYG